VTDDIESLLPYCDRTSSIATLDSKFARFLTKDALGEIRYQSTSKAWVGALEPLTALEDRAARARMFFEEAAREGKRALLTPVSERLARALPTYPSLQLGAEPIWELSKVFEDGVESRLEYFPVARSLKRRGVEMVEVEWEKLSSLELDELMRVHQGWCKRKASQLPEGLEYHFLSATEPWRPLPGKRTFYIRHQATQKIQAFLNLIPVFPSGYYALDLIRHPEARAGSMELLLHEVMATLYQEGVQEFRLGMAFGAKIQCNSLLEKVIHWVFKTQRFSQFHLREHFEFKSRLMPTRWEPLFAVGSAHYRLRPDRWMQDLFRIQFQRSPLSVLWQIYFPKFRNHLRTELLPNFLELRLPVWTDRFRIPFGTLLSVSFFCILYATIQVQDSWKYQPGNVSFTGIILSPFFHNNLYHLLGDQAALLFFGGILEARMKRNLLWPVILMGLFLSNPVTHLIVLGFLKLVGDPTLMSHFLSERDIGSSNAIYAMIGALSACIRKPAWLLIPFTLNASMICIFNQSLLSLHHIFAMGMGWAWMHFRTRSTVSTRD
jgi:membrane associated rhomboid family serine protease